MEEMFLKSCHFGVVSGIFDQPEGPPRLTSDDPA
jgi:hypothetical protein